MICTFFGHSDCYGLDKQILEDSIKNLIHNGVNTFYVGNQGEFDRIVHRLLRQLKKQHPHIQYSVVLAYLPKEKRENEDFSDTVFPENIEVGPARFAIERRNNWMIQDAQYCVCYINHPWGGAYKFAQKAKRRKLTVINLGDLEL